MIPNNILLLKIIENNGKISLLRDRGLTHSQIAMMIKNLEAEGNILITDDDILLTPKGIEFLENNISRIINGFYHKSTCTIRLFPLMK